MYYQFTRDLRDGHHGENAVIERLTERLENFELLERCDDKRFDFAANINGRRFTFEVKNDLLAETTGNVAVEFQCRGSWSGIYSTAADAFVFVVGTRMVLVSVKALKRAHKSNRFRVVSAGDAKSARCFLLSLAELSSIGVDLSSR